MQFDESHLRFITSKLSPAMLKPVPYQKALQGFAALVERTHEDASIDLVAGGFAIARTEYPLLDTPHYLGRLESLAGRVRARMRASPTARETIALLNRVLFDEEGLRGNREDYYDPRNSFLNDVLDRKLGIPITLSVIYMHVASRVGFPIAGTGMPGHFLLKHYDVMSGEILIDPFNRGQVVGRVECQKRLDEIYSGQLELRPEFTRAVSHREILTRMLNNLRQIYFSRRNLSKGLVILDLLLAIPPQCPDLIRERGLVRLNLEHYLGAAQDLGRYLQLEPEAADADDVRETLEMLRQLLARLN
jgi:regulator of sirC expression with transglutaminase-like and TPR domain